MQISAFLFVTLCFAGSAIAGTSTAQTPDNSSDAVPTISRSQPTWSGFYTGLQVGGHFTNTLVETAQQATVNATKTDLSRNGAFGGIQFGYGRQLRSIYVGGESDSAFGRLISGHIVATDNGSSKGTFQAHQRFVGTVRGKVGRPFGRWLVYGTVGLAIAGLAQGATVPADDLHFKTGNEGVELGYVVGGGVEYRANRRFSYQVESTYYRLQDEGLKVAAGSGSGIGYSSTLQNSGSLLRVVANYHF